MVALLLYVSAVASGLFAGAMLTEGMVLVPYWRAVPAVEFLAWYRANHDRLLGYFGAVTVFAFVATWAAALGVLWSVHPGRWPALTAAILVLLTVVMFPLYFRGVNDRFASGDMPSGDVRGELARWAALHWYRTAVALVAFGAALLAVHANGSRGV